MAKSKEQKQLEAKFRQVRGALIDSYRETDSKKLIDSLLYKDLNNLTSVELEIFQRSGVLNQINKINNLKKEFLTYPIDLQLNAFDEWYIDDIEDLKIFRVEIEKEYILNKVSSPNFSIKTHKRI